VIEFDQRTSELIRTGETAALLLDAQKRMCALCVEEVLKKIDRAVLNDTLSPERALAYVSEIAAFRRIVARQQQEIDVGKSAARRQEQSQ